MCLAGQVSPEIGAATFGLAQKAVVVGDTAQIEPVRSLTPSSDFANLKEKGLDPELPNIKEYMSSRGTVMGMAQHASRFSRPGRTDGLWLEEHRRCVPEVIGYCNDLVYDGLLIPKRKSVPESDRILPALGWGHIRTTARKAGGSWVNPDEAAVIAEWVNDRAGELEAHYDKPLSEIVGIISPYKAQATEIQRALRRSGSGKGVAVGTVHTFQGGERPVIILSTTVTHDRGRRFMMDSGPNLLNVAVSRAKDSFLVLGDMAVFDPQALTPSGKLALRLFARPENAIPDLVARPELLQLSTKRLDTLEDHREALRSALTQSRKQVLIVSPYLTRSALEADDVPALVQGATNRGVSVAIVYSSDFYQREGLVTVRRLGDILRRAGADVHELRRFHNKTLSCDDLFLVEGSFNWLSAVRDNRSPYQRHEASLKCGRPDCQDMIVKAWKEVKKAAGLGK